MPGEPDELEAMSYAFRGCTGLQHEVIAMASCCKKGGDSPSRETITATTPSGSRPAVTAHPEQKLLAPRPLFTAAREVKTVVPVSSVTPVTPPRPLRTGEQTAALWIAPYIDNQDVYHQPSSVFFVIKPSAWGKPRIN